MFKKLSCVILIACFVFVLCPPMASAGIDPSPFKVYLAQTIQQIIVRVEIMDTAGTVGNGGADQIIARLQAIADSARNATNVVLAKNALGAMDRITAVLFAPQPEPPRVLFPELIPLVLRTLDELIALGFETPPEMISLATESSRLTERITARLFAPQPEPPMPDPAIIAAGINIVSGISQLTLETTTAEWTTAKMVIGALSQIDEVLFAPQPEPPRLLIPMLGILDRMSDLYFQVTPGPNVQ